MLQWERGRTQKWKGFVYKYWVVIQEELSRTIKSFQLRVLIVRAIQENGADAESEHDWV